MNKPFKLVVALMVSAYILYCGLPSTLNDDQQQMLSPLIAHADSDEDDREYESVEESPYEEIFAWIGKLAVVMGALSLSWYFMKRKRVSKIKSVRRLSNLFYSLHNFTGWGALFFIIAHGTYFLWNEWPEIETLTGLLAFTTLITLIIYGVKLDRQLKPRTRRIHFILAFIWVGVTIIHATDAIPLLILVVGSSYLLIWLLERKHAKELNQSP
jgi:hypothetical protein